MTWDVVDVMLADAERGCAEGLFEPLDPAFLAPAPDGTPPAENLGAGAAAHRRALRSDFAWWGEHGERIAARFARWLEAPARTPGQLAR